ncbi:MAG: hypothetical protein CGU28_01850 [Candidatus Dactylopiibacterium carminicum]|nr:MAG: hypothetical protein CGU28_01850 [Candidatus Dactylopiibacterium carminicum]
MITNARRNLRLWAILTALAVNTFGIALVAAGLYILYGIEIHKGQVQTQNLAYALEQNVSRQVERIDFYLNTLVGELGDLSGSGHLTTTNVQKRIAQTKAILEETDGWIVTDRHGTVIQHQGATTLEASVSVADRDYFLALSAGSADFLFVSAPVFSRITGTQVLIFARAYRDGQRQFAGVVLAALPLAHLTKMLSGFSIGRNGSLTLRDSRLGIIARHTETGGAEAAPPGDTRVSETLRQHLRNGEKAATYIATSPLDNVTRINSYQVLDNAPMLAFASLSKDEVLEGWKQLCRMAALLLGCFLLITNVSAAFLYRYWRLQRLYVQKQRESNTRLSQSLQQLRERDNALAAAQKAGGIGTYSLDIAGDRWTASRQLDAMFGIPESYPHTLEGWYSRPTGNKCWTTSGIARSPGASSSIANTGSSSPTINGSSGCMAWASWSWMKQAIPSG